MTGGEGEADRRTAVQNREGAQATDIHEPARTRGPATASHAITVLIPDERPVLIRYGFAVVATALALAVTLPAASLLERAVFVLFWPAVIGAAWFGGIGPAILASTLSVLAVDYFLIGPPRELTLGSPEDLIPLAVFLFASTAVAMLTSAARAARRSAAEAALQNANLAHELELQTMELEQQLEESQSLSEELEQSTE